jgi:hypothetical protein
MIAAAGVALSTLLVVLVVVPFAELRHFVGIGAVRDVGTRLALTGVPGLALLLVGAHASHGLALDVGARKVGARGARSHALRFGLYAAGWDLVLGPVGAVVLAAKEGAAGLQALAGVAVGLPGRCARAFLQGAYRLPRTRIEEANATGTNVAIAATILGAVAVLSAAVAAWWAI